MLERGSESESEKSDHSRPSEDNLSQQEHEVVFSDDAVLERVSQLESLNAKHLVLTPFTAKLMEDMFDNVYTELQPTMIDYQARRIAFEFVDALVRHKVSVGYTWREFGACSVKAFGSYTMDMFNPTSDLDLSLNVGSGVDSFTRENKINILRRLTRCLRDFQNRGGHIRDIQPILRAKVPVVKFIDCRSELECDVSVENRDGIMNSELLRIFSCLDRRFRKLCFLMKAWAKAHGINSSKDRTLNSLTIILLVAFHLQTLSPPILPPFSVFLEGVHLPAFSSALLEVQRRVEWYKDFGRNNKESIAQLFNSLLRRLVAVEELWQQGLCASTYLGHWTSTTNPGFIYVEDFTVRSQNAARAVGEDGFRLIYRQLHESVVQMEDSFVSALEVMKLNDELFRHSVSPRKRHLDGPAVHNVAKYQKTEAKRAVVNKSRDHIIEQDEIVHDIASWLTFGEKSVNQVPVNKVQNIHSAVPVMAHGNVVQLKSRLKNMPHDILAPPHSRRVEQPKNMFRDARESEGIARAQKLGKHQLMEPKTVGSGVEFLESKGGYGLKAYPDQYTLLPEWNDQNRRDAYYTRHILPAAHRNPSSFLSHTFSYRERSNMSSDFISNQQIESYNNFAPSLYQLPNSQMYRYDGVHGHRLI
eukprot:c28986_g2_i1 orf=281-2209(+)